MARQEGIEWGFYFDTVHIISVNYRRGEVRLFENGGSGDGKLLFTKDEPAAKVALNDPFALMNMAIHFVVSYELLAQLVDERVLRFFEQVGIKEFLEKLATATTAEDRHHRFTGLGPKFTTFVKAATTETQSSPSPSDDKASEPQQPPPTAPPEPAAAATVSAPPNRQNNRAKH